MILVNLKYTFQYKQINYCNYSLIFILYVWFNNKQTYLTPNIHHYLINYYIKLTSKYVYITNVK